MPNIRVIPLNWWNDEKQAQVCPFLLAYWVSF